MSRALAEKITPHLPYLRRFARALTGSQDRGDNYVVAMLEALIADSSTFPAGMDTKLGTYRTFLRVWSSVPQNSEKEDAGSVAADRRIETLTPLPRQAFLLTALEEFTAAESARILDLDEAEVKNLVEQAGREISEQLKAKVLIIEDEPMIAMDIEGIVTDLGHDVVGIARTHRDAAELAKVNSPGLILADIQLADGSSGIDAVNDILASASVPVIFVTAFPERLLTGQRAEPAFLLSKPFQPEMLAAVISQALFFEVTAKSTPA